MDTFWLSVDDWLGLHRQPHELEFSHMALRGAIVFLCSIAIVRFGDKRFLGRNAAFDAILVIILGSVLSRAINGHAAFFPTLGASAVLVLVHWLLATLAVHSSFVSYLVKGRDEVLVRDGQMDRAMMCKVKVTEGDLWESLRANGKVDDLAKVKEARLERNGKISVVTRE